MLPGAVSESGFLAPGERLDDVRAQDSERLARLGLTHAQVADRIEWRFAYARESQIKQERQCVIAGLTLELSSMSSRSTSQHCPKRCAALSWTFVSLGNTPENSSEIDFVERCAFRGKPRPFIFAKECGVAPQLAALRKS